MNVWEFWRHEFGDTDEACDFTGRRIAYHLFGRYAHRLGWVTERISPYGAGMESNLHIVSVATQLERRLRTEFSVGGADYRVLKAAHAPSEYDYSRKDFAVVRSRFPEDLWQREFGSAAEGLDFSGRVVVRELFHRPVEGGWNLDHILPLAKGGRDEYCNLQIASTYANTVKADRLEFVLNGRRYRVLRQTEATDAQACSTPYRYECKAYCVALIPTEVSEIV